MHKSHKLLLCFLLFLFLFLIWENRNPQEKFPLSEHDTITLSGKVTNNQDAYACLEVLRKNLTAASEKNLEASLETVSNKAKKATKKELETVYASYDLVHELLSFRVLAQESHSLFVEAFQWTKNTGTSVYQNHIAQIHYTFVLEADEWKISEAFITQIELTD